VQGDQEQHQQGAEQIEQETGENPKAACYAGHSLTHVNLMCLG
jgi:hypothetical protein